MACEAFRLFQVALCSRGSRFACYQFPRSADRGVECANYCTQGEGSAYHMFSPCQEGLVMICRLRLSPLAVIGSREFSRPLKQARSSLNYRTPPAASA